MKRLFIGLYVAGGLSFLVAFIIGFIPGRICGSYLAPLATYSTLVPRSVEGNKIAMLKDDAPCFGTSGYPVMFWFFVWLGILLLVAGIVVQQVMLHRSGKSPSAPKPVKTAVYVSAPDIRVATRPASTGSFVDQIAKLNELHQSGALSAQEFTVAKARLLGNGSESGAAE